MANENDARLKTFALIIKFGHDLFEKKDLAGVAAAAVNDSRILLGFRSSAIYRMQDHKKIDLLGQFAQTEIHEYSAAVLAQKKLIADTVFDPQGIAVIGNEHLPEELSGNDAVYLLCRLTPPETAHLECSYIWLLEYEKDVPKNVVTTAQLLGRSVAEALCLAECSASGIRRKFTRASGRALRMALLAALLGGAMLIPVEERTTAEFMLKAPAVTAAYAKADGFVSQCLKQDGAYVRKDEVIVRFDTAELQYRLENARAALKEAEADLELARQNAFTDEKNLGKVKLQQARCDILKVSVKEAEWYLQNAEIKSPAEGVLVLTDEWAEQASGKSVRTGDKLFEIYGGSGMIAEIMVHERDSSILQHTFKSELFLHTAPEKGFSGNVISAAQYPVLSEKKTYCYPIRIQLEDETCKNLRFGMRGIAKLTGEKISLGYYLFKNLILYFRNW